MIKLLIGVKSKNDYWWVRREYRSVNQTLVRKLKWWEKFLYLGMSKIYDVEKIE
jgi:hypothetical protein